MAIRQYIGARYVPLYVGDWDITRNYEPLSIVTDANGNSFTSLKDVPAGTQLTDRNYWIQTSSFSAAVQQLQNRVYDLEQNDADQDNEIANLDRRVDTLETSEGKDVYLLVSDSYGGRVNSQGKTFTDIINDRSEKNVQGVFLGSAGFGAALKLLTALESYSGDKTKVKKIIIVAGANDIAQTYAAIIQGMQAFRSYLNINYPGIPVAIFACGISTAYQTGNYINMLMSYKAGCGRFDFEYVDNSEFVLHNSTLIADTTHPNETGVDTLANAIEMALDNDVCQVSHDLSLAGSLSQLGDNVASVTSYMKESLKNNLHTIASYGTQYLFEVVFTDPEAINANKYTPWKRVAALTNWLFTNTNDANDDVFILLGEVTYSDNTTEPCTALFTIKGGYIWANVKVSQVKTVKSYKVFGYVTSYPLYS